MTQAFHPYLNVLLFAGWRGWLAAVLAVIGACTVGFWTVDGIAWLIGRWSARAPSRHRACAACGHQARDRDPLRFYRLQRVYPAGRRLPRWQVMLVHRAHLASPQSGLYRPAWRRVLSVRWRS